MNFKDYPCCYETTDLGLVTRFLCSRYGWTKGLARCQCKHHDAEASLYAEIVAGRAAA